MSAGPSTPGPSAWCPARRVGSPLSAGSCSPRTPLGSPTTPRHSTALALPWLRVSQALRQRRRPHRRGPAPGRGQRRRVANANACRYRYPTDRCRQPTPAPATAASSRRPRRPALLVLSRAGEPLVVVRRGISEGAQQPADPWQHASSAWIHGRSALLALVVALLAKPAAQLLPRPR